MPFRRLDTRLIPRLRGGLVAVSAMAFIAVAVGVPVPSVTLKDRSVAFPCMDRSCGCHDAAGCKEHCCCFSSEEKLVWAAEHGVDATPFVNAQARAAAVLAGCDEHQGEGNHDQQSASCCAKTKPIGRASQRPTDQRHSHDVLSISAYRQCHGLAPLWTLLGAALPPPERVSNDFHWIVTGQVVQQDCVLAKISFSPPTPPPRV